MNNIRLYDVSDADAHFLTYIMNIDDILTALNELPTQLEDWEDAIKAWKNDDDEEDYIISDCDKPIGWLGINGLESDDKVAYLKLVALLPDYQNKGIGRYAISEIVKMLRLRKYSKVALYTDMENYRARACYEKCGFEVTEAFNEEMANGKTIARCKMELKLDLSI